MGEDGEQEGTEQRNGRVRETDSMCLGAIVSGGSPA